MEDRKRNAIIRYSAWSVAGVAVGVGALFFGFLVLIAVAAAAGAWAWRNSDARPLGGLLSGVGLLLLAVAWIQRRGPGVVCTHIHGDVQCDQYMNPIPWLLFGALFVAVGAVVGFARHRGAGGRPHLTQ